jgi:hypothetical protein
VYVSVALLTREEGMLLPTTQAKVASWTRALVAGAVMTDPPTRFFSTSASRALIAGVTPGVFVVGVGKVIGLARNPVKSHGPG